MASRRCKKFAARLLPGAALLLVLAAWPAVPSLAGNLFQQAPPGVVYGAGWNLIAGLPGMDLSGALPGFYTLQPGDSDYETARSSAELKSGAGYWASFTADAPLVLPAGTSAPFSLLLPAGQYAMVGNPSGRLPATVAGADSVLTYDPVAGYTSTTSLAPGRGAWVFSAAGGAVTVTPDPQAAAPAPAQAPAAPLDRATADRPDDQTGAQVHFMYVLPSDGVDRALDTNGTMARSVAAFQSWLAGQTGGRRLRVDTYQGKLDVTFFRMSESDAEVSGAGAVCTRRD